MITVLAATIPTRRSARRVALAAVVTLLAAAPRAGFAQQGDTVTLAVGRPIERAMATGVAPHQYRVDLVAGQHLRAVVEQRGVDVVVAV